MLGEIVSASDALLQRPIDDTQRIGAQGRVEKCYEIFYGHVYRPRSSLDEPAAFGPIYTKWLATGIL